MANPYIPTNRSEEHIGASQHDNRSWIIMDNYKAYKGDWEIESRSRQNPYIFWIFEEQYEDIQYKWTERCCWLFYLSAQTIDFCHG